MQLVDVAHVPVVLLLNNILRRHQQTLQFHDSLPEGLVFIDGLVERAPELIHKLFVGNLGVVVIDDGPVVYFFCLQCGVLSDGWVILSTTDGVESLCVGPIH